MMNRKKNIMDVALLVAALLTTTTLFCHTADGFSATFSCRRRPGMFLARFPVVATKTQLFTFSYLDSLSQNGGNNQKGNEGSASHDKLDQDPISNGDYSSCFAGGGTMSAGEVYQDQYGRTITPSTSTASDNVSTMQQQQQEQRLTSGDSVEHPRPTRRSSIQPLDDVNNPNNPFYTVGKDQLKNGGGSRYSNARNGNTNAHARRSTGFDFEAECDKYLRFPSQRFGHDRLQPANRGETSHQRKWTDSVMEEQRVSTMFHSINQADAINARAAAKKPKIDLSRLNDVISNPSPFRFLGSTDPNVSYREPRAMTGSSDNDSMFQPAEERQFFGSRKSNSARQKQEPSDVGPTDDGLFVVT
jgi:hypothetical protein